MDVLNWVSIIQKRLKFSKERPLEYVSAKKEVNVTFLHLNYYKLQMAVLIRTENNRKYTFKIF